MGRWAIVFACLLLSCNRDVSYETVDMDGREFRVVSAGEEEYQGHCVMKVVFLTEEDNQAKVTEEATVLVEQYWGDHIADRCGWVVMQGAHLIPRLGGLFSQTRYHDVLFDHDGLGHWRRTPTRQ